MDRETFGKFIADRRHELRMTQQNLANQLHVTDKAVSKWERGLCYPDLTMLENLADVLGLTVGELMACEKLPEEIHRTNLEALLEIAGESQTRQKKRIVLLVCLAALAGILLTGAVLLLAAVNCTDSGYVSFVGKKTNAAGYFVYVEEDGRLLCLRCPDRQLYDTIQTDKKQLYSIEYRWNRFTYEGILKGCKEEGTKDFYTPMDELGSSFGIDSLLGISCPLQEIKNVYPDPARQGKYLYTYRFFYKGNGNGYYLGTDMPETHIVMVENCRSVVIADYDEDGITELFVLTKYEEAPFILYDLEDGSVVSYFVDEVPDKVLQALRMGALDFD